MGRDFSRDKLRSNIAAYKSGQHPASGVDPEIAKEAVLDDLLVAFNEEGFDTHGDVQRALETGYQENPDKKKVEDAVKSAVRGIFNQFLETVGVMNDLLPGDEEDLFDIIVDDLLDGDERSTI